jgi:hypothetical protein
MSDAGSHHRVIPPSATEHIMAIEQALKAGPTKVAGGQHGTLMRDEKSARRSSLPTPATEEARGGSGLGTAAVVIRLLRCPEGLNG